MFRTRAAAAAILAVYVGAYLAFRHASIEVWEQDRHTYVTQGYGLALYYLWRLLSYGDGVLTGMRFHLGPHRP